MIRTVIISLFLFAAFIISVFSYNYFSPLLIYSPLSSRSLPPPIDLLSPTPSPYPQLVLGLVGDLGLGRHITATARAKNDFSWSFRNVKPWLQQNHFTLANLESPIVAACPEGRTGTFTFCGDDRFLPYLKENKFVFNLNNNHILNYGSNGLAQTKKYLDTDYFYDNFYIKEINGIEFGFLGYDFVTYPKTDTQSVLDAVKTHDPDVDYLIVSLHWGNEYLPSPEKWRRELAHGLVDAGADIIHGHHPHVWQPEEIYHGKPIFYSLGNFIFDQSWSYETSHTQIARLVLTKNEIISIEKFPVEIRHNSQPVITSSSLSPAPTSFGI